MIPNQPVSRVVDLLEKEGYRRCNPPVKVASVPFEFAALLVGSNRSLDLIAVIDTLVDSEVRIQQKVEGLSRALDLVASRRPLTIVLVGPAPRAIIVEALTRVCRVLSVGTPTGENADRLLHDALAVLLPLELAEARDSVVDSFGEVRRHLGSAGHGEEIAALLSAALRGTGAVTQTLRELLLNGLDHARTPGRK
jgi:hypothetical protein